MCPQLGSVPSVTPRATNSLAVCMWLASSSSGLPSVVPMALNWLTLCIQKTQPALWQHGLAASPAATVYAADMLGFPRLSWQLPRHGSCGRATLSLKDTVWGHREHCALALCFLPPVVSIFFLITGNKRECHQHTPYCLFPRSPATGQCHPSPCTPVSIPASLLGTSPGWGASSTHLGPGQVRLYPHVMVPAHGVAAGNTGMHWRGPRPETVARHVLVEAHPARLGL